jgi:RNA polymerase sigma-70 factor (ECF subfamily)
MTVSHLEPPSASAELPEQVRAAALGDVAAFRALYDRTIDRVCRTASWLLGRGDVEDVVQDVFVRVWERLPSLDEPAAFDAWLHRLAVNVILRRREKGARARGEVDLTAANAATTFSRGDVALRLDLEESVQLLPQGARDVFLLYDVEGYSHKEISVMLAISHHTSRSQLHRARALLRTLLARGEELET